MSGKIASTVLTYANNQPTRKEASRKSDQEVTFYRYG